MFEGQKLLVSGVIMNCLKIPQTWLLWSITDFQFSIPFPLIYPKISRGTTKYPYGHVSFQ